MKKDKSRQGVGAWNRDGTEDWKRHNWFYSYVPQYVDGVPMHKAHKREYNRKWNGAHMYRCSITLNKEKDADCVELIDNHIPSLSGFVKFCLRAYADYYHIFDDEGNDTYID